MFRVFWRAVRDVFDDMFLLILTNLVWSAITWPLLGLALFAGLNGFPLPATMFALLGVLPLGPAMAGLYTIAQRTTEGRTSKLTQFFEGMRQHAKFSWKVYGIWMVVLVALVFNLGFYGGMNSTVGAFLQVLFLYLIGIWFALLIYIGPLMLLQADKSILVLARNAMLMAFGRPVFTLVTFVMMLLITVLSLLPGVFLIPGLILFSLLAVWSFRATTKLIEDAEERRRLAEEQAVAAGNGPRYNNDKGRGGQIKPRE